MEFPLETFNNDTGLSINVLYKGITLFNFVQPRLQCLCTGHFNSYPHPET